MQNTIEPIVNNVAGRVVVGFVDSVSDHPFATCALSAAIAMALGLLWLDLLDGDRGERTDGR